MTKKTKTQISSAPIAKPGSSSVQTRVKIVNKHDTSYACVLDEELESRSKLLVYRGSALGHPAKILIDCGASVNVMSRRFAQKSNAKTKFKKTIVLTFPDGSTQDTAEMIESVPIHIDGQNFNSRVLIGDIKSYNLILGMPWFMKYEPNIDWRRRRITHVMKPVRPLMPKKQDAKST